MTPGIWTFDLQWLPVFFVHWLGVSFLQCGRLSSSDYLQIVSTVLLWLFCSVVGWAAVITCSLFPLFGGDFLQVGWLSISDYLHFFPLVSDDFCSVVGWAEMFTCSLLSLVSCVFSALWSAEQQWLHVFCFQWLAVNFLLCFRLGSSDYLQSVSTSRRWLSCRIVGWAVVITCKMFPLVCGDFCSVVGWAAVITCILCPLVRCDFSALWSAEQQWVPAICLH